MRRLDVTLVIFVIVVIVSVSTAILPGADEHIKIQTKHVLETDNLLLVCNTTEQPDLEDFFWIKNDTSKETSVVYRDGWKLVFVDIRRTASGVYTCHALNNRTGHNVTLAAYKIDVQFPAEIEMMYLSPQQITENQTFSITCSLHGNPQPVWSIMNRDTGRAIMQANASAEVTLTGNHVMCGDSGFWMCTGSNRLNKGVNVTKGYNLTVICPPKPDPNYLHTYDYMASLGSTVTLVLNIAADPQPVFKWSRDDGKRLGHVAQIDGPRLTKLIIMNVSMEDFGNYSLNMASAVGTYTAKFHLKAYGYPGKPYNFSASSITHNSVDLTWTSGFDSGSHQSFQIMKWTSVNVFSSITQMISGPYEDGGVGKQWRYLLTGLEPDTQYKLTVMAKNAKNITFSDPIIFNTTAEPHSVNKKAGFQIVVAGCVVLGLLFAIALGVSLAVNHVYKKRRSYQLEDKKSLADDLKSNYGGTLDVNTGIKEQYPQTVAKY